MAKAPPSEDEDRGVFLDRDGVINVYRPDYVRTVEDFEYYDFVPEAWAVLARLGLPLVVVTNQSGIARGYTTEEIVAEIHDSLRRDAALWGAPLAAVEHCPHHPRDGCDCRKPGPALFERGAREAGVVLEGSYLIGDAPADMAAGHRLGMITLRVATGRGSEPAEPGTQSWSTENFLAAALKIEELERLRSRCNDGPDS